ncbi:MAG: hypothetical protein EKK34_25265 [Mycobacterium sp.]|nr:MAG: hypothetical protein EKK34_25265 [Mycobacterium sp.]
MTESDVRWFAAIPFVVSALAVVATWLGYISVRKRFFKDFEALAEANVELDLTDEQIKEKLAKAKLAADAKMQAKLSAIFDGVKRSQILPSKYHPGPLQQRFDRDTDAATSFASGLLIFITALVVMPDTGRGPLIILTAIGAVSSFGVFTFIFNAELGTYSRTIKKGISLLSVVILILNLALAAVAYNTAPYTPPQKSQPVDPTQVTP